MNDGNKSMTHYKMSKSYCEPVVPYELGIINISKNTDLNMNTNINMKR